MDRVLESLKAEFNNHVSFRVKRVGIVQILAPFYHEDGDMIDMFIDLPKSPQLPILISDHGLTLMRLSYNCDFETPKRRKVLDRMLSENGVTETEGRLSLEATQDSLYPSILQFAQTIAKISSIQAFNYEVIRSLFYESLGEFVTSALCDYRPSGHFLPIPSREDIEVDWKFSLQPKPIFLFGVRDTSKARLAAFNCVVLQQQKIPFRSVIVHENFETELSKKDQSRITNVVDKQFSSLADFRSGGQEYFAREAESSTIQ